VSSFTEPLSITYIGGGLYQVDKGFRYYVGAENSDDYVDVPIGFITDFASVPDILDRIILRDGDYNQAAVVHDFLYYLHRVLRDRYTKDFKLDAFMANYPLDTVKNRDRNEVDKIFYDAMTLLDSLPEYHIPWWKRQIMYRFVHMFSWIPWNKKQS
jgi:hypothetical protein